MTKRLVRKRRLVRNDLFR